eukprot:CAMPEP_0194032642 /NCGR_PEP_ID=MMETSP0009_2-20130614/5535_1 /TAXON_ID=210454 /ORGANISM="Grammatophora oceanica, Strain CCMP 410" /LENGTH=444 /DNA_ID=CAMNT_0038673149 /DNA_START=45 /DNA_END=1379 /DNA_ORIENTATION=-
MRSTSAALFALMIVAPATGAFQIKPHAFGTQHRAARSSNRRWASIYYPDGGHSDDFLEGYGDEGSPAAREFFGYEDQGARSASKEEHYHSQRLVEELTRQEMSALARLAVAFCPEGQQLGLKNIEHVEVLDVDENHLDIQAVVCNNDEGCVTVKVPVAFPHTCADADDVEGCILDNFYELDHVAEERIEEIQWSEKRSELTQSSWKQLTNRDKGDLPSWWIPPFALAEECDTLRSLLNEEDFQEELVALAVQSLLKPGAHPLPLAADPVFVPPQPVKMNVDVPMKIEESATTLQELNPIEAFLQSFSDKLRRLTELIVNWLADDAFSWLPKEETLSAPPKVETMAEFFEAEPEETVSSFTEFAAPPPSLVPAENEELAKRVEQAAVAAICPAGMYMRAKTGMKGKSEIVDVPVAFEETAKSVDELREVIMSKIESVTPTPVVTP